MVRDAFKIKTFWFCTHFPNPKGGGGISSLYFTICPWTCICRTCERERGHLVLQIGTSNGDRAAQVAKKMEKGKK